MNNQGPAMVVGVILCLIFTAGIAFMVNDMVEVGNRTRAKFDQCIKECYPKYALRNHGGCVCDLTKEYRGEK